MTTYVPRAGSIPARAVEHLQTLDAGSAVSTTDLAALLGADPTSMSACLNAARRHGAIDARRDGRGLVWFLPEEDTTEEDAEPVPFNAALWSDGDLVIYGAQANEDGSVTLSAEQVAQVKCLISPVVSA